MHIIERVHGRCTAFSLIITVLQNLTNFLEVGNPALVRVSRVVGQADVEEASVFLCFECVHVSDTGADDEVLGVLEDELSGFACFNNPLCFKDL